MASMAEALGTINQYKDAVKAALSAADTIAAVLQQGLDVQKEVQALSARRGVLLSEIAGLEAKLDDLRKQQSVLEGRVKALTDGIDMLRRI